MNHDLYLNLKNARSESPATRLYPSSRLFFIPKNKSAIMGCKELLFSLCTLFYDHYKFPHNVISSNCTRVAGYDLSSIQSLFFF